MIRVYYVFSLLTVVTTSLCGQQLSSAVYTATFNNIGIEVTFSTETPGGSTVSVAISNETVSPVWRDGHPLSRVAANRFIGSVFGLESGTKYLIRLSGSDDFMERFDTVVTRTDTFHPPEGSVYHVAENGSDENTGISAVQAFSTLARALSTAQPGATILLHEGRYFESVNIRRSGTADAPILIRNAPGETAVLDGRDTTFNPSWASVDNAAGIYRTACSRRPHFAYYNGGHLYASPSLDDLIANTWDMPSGYFCNGTWMYVRFPHTGVPSDDDTVEIPAQTIGITCSGMQHIHIRGLEICYYGLDQYPRGIYFNESSYNLVDSCYLHHSGIGIGLKRASDFNTVQNCRFTESQIDTWNWSAVKEGTGYYEAGGVVVYGSSSINSGNVIRNNRFSHMFDGSCLYSEDESGPTANMDFHGNTVEYVNDDCVETDGAGTNCRIYGNTFRKFLTGVSVAPAAIGPTYIFRNLFTDWESHGVYVGYPFKFNVTSDLSTEWVYLYHNTCYTAVAEQPGFLFKQYSDWSNVISRNNIYAGTTYALESWSDRNPVDFDYDVLYTSASDMLIDWAGNKYSTITTFSAQTGQETHGIAAAPEFADVQTADFRLSDNSPLIDKGILIPGINNHFAGNSPDIGCFEFGLTETTTKPKQERQQTMFTVYGNRTTGGITLRLDGIRIFSPIRINIFRIDGRQLHSDELYTSENRIYLPIKAVPPGIYCVRATVADQEYRSVFTVIRKRLPLFYRSPFQSSRFQASKRPLVN